MKMAPAKPNHGESGPNMTPLVDVVMVILIFLMLAGSFGATEHYMQSQTAMHDKGVQSDKAPDPNYVPPILIEVQVNKAGGVLITGRSVAITDTTREGELEKALAGLLEKMKNDSAAGGKKVDVELVLRPHRDVEWDKLAPVYDSALRAKFEKIGFAASR